MIGETIKHANRDQFVAVALLIGAVVMAMATSLDWWTEGSSFSLLTVILAFLAGALIGRVRGRELERAERMKREARQGIRER